MASLLLHGRITPHLHERRPPRVLRITQNRNKLGDNLAYLASGSEASSLHAGVAVVLTFSGDYAAEDDCRVIQILTPELSYLGEGDIVRLDTVRGRIHVLYRRSSATNTFLVTEQCNSRCVMCSQPPREIDDAYLINEVLEAIPLVDPETEVLGITGGEPTLYWDGLLRIIASARKHLPLTALHILSNGRLFAYRERARAIAGLQHPDLVFGIPLYSDLPEDHDFVVQARGAYQETLRGLLNLARFRVRVELRMVIHRYTYRRLANFADFVRWNLPFVDHVALMGLEPMGYGRANLDNLWIDPGEYQRELTKCVERLVAGRVLTSIYNHQLCHLDRSLWPYAAKSISDWKNLYLAECETCSVNEYCGGFFASAISQAPGRTHAVPFETLQLQKFSARALHKPEGSRWTDE